MSVITAYCQSEDLQTPHILSDIESLDKKISQMYLQNGGDLAKLKGTGYKLYVHKRQFLELRRNAEGTLNSASRWEQLKQIRENRGSAKDGAPTPDWVNEGPFTVDDHGGQMISNAKVELGGANQSVKINLENTSSTLNGTYI